MHIENATININLPGVPAGALAALMGFDFPDQEPGNVAAARAPDSGGSVPAIGQPWPGIEGSVYAGVSRGEDGQPDAHMVLLADEPDDGLEWDEAVKWAEGLGDGARLPTRFESALLYANVRDSLDTERAHWTGTQYSGGDAWAQNVSGGYQGTNGKKAQLRARAVRRIS